MGLGFCLFAQVLRAAKQGIFDRAASLTGTDFNEINALRQTTNLG
jgi:hypothetical protein